MSNKESDLNKQEILVREAKVLVWGPIFITLSLEKINNVINNSEPVLNPAKKEKQQIEDDIENLGILENKPLKPKEQEEEINSHTKTKINILKPISTQKALEQTKQVIQSPENDDNTKKVTYIYNLVDHGLDCECIDIKGELLIRSALPVYRKITQGIEFEQITTNQIKLIITSRVLDNYQEVFQGFTTPKATFRIWILGYKF